MRDHFAAIRAKHRSRPDLAGNAGNRETSPPGARQSKAFRVSQACFPAPSARETGHLCFPQPHGRETDLGNRQVTDKEGKIGSVSRVSLVSRIGTIEAARTAPARWTAEDWRAYFAERAAVRELDGGQSRAEAERGAFEDTVDQWLACYPAEPTSDANGCVYCGERERPWNALLPIVTPNGAVWMHDQCWPDWHAHRRAQARAALVQTGLHLPEAQEAAPTADLPSSCGEVSGT